MTEIYQQAEQVQRPAAVADVVPQGAAGRVPLAAEASDTMSLASQPATREMLAGGRMPRARVRRFRHTTVALAVAGALISACSPQKPAPPAAAPPTNALWGEMKPVVSVKEIMQYMIDPASDYIFDSVSTVIDPRGRTIEKAPKTDEDWEKLRIGAVTIAEGVYLLKVPRRFPPPGDENNSVGPDATELSPAQILAKVQKDPVEWNARIEALRNVGLEVLEIVKKKNVQELWDASENLDVACEQCHSSYWYPKEDAQFYRALDRRLKDVPQPPLPGSGHGKSPTRGAPGSKER